MIVMPRFRSPLIRAILTGIGLMLIVGAPLVGILPGPGGIFVFAAGLILVLKNAGWARRHFARLKKRYPRFGRYADMALRRRSFRLREQRRKHAAMAAAEAANPGFHRNIR